MNRPDRRPDTTHAGQILFSLARWFDWFQNTLCTEVQIDGGRADLLVISKARYVTEIEIKTSLSDWNADQHKDKWLKPRPHIKRFFYAVPLAMAREKTPAWLPPHVGVLGCRLFDVHTVRDARALRAQKVSDRFLSDMRDAMYYRFWRDRMRRDYERFYRPPPPRIGITLVGSAAA